MRVGRVWMRRSSCATELAGGGREKVWWWEAAGVDLDGVGQEENGCVELQ